MHKGMEVCVGMGGEKQFSIISSVHGQACTDNGTEVPERLGKTQCLHLVARSGRSTKDARKSSSILKSHLVLAYASILGA